MANKADYTQLITLDDLNIVYDSLQTDIANVSKIYDTRGNTDWTTITGMKSCTQGQVFTVIEKKDEEEPKSIKNNDNLLCINNFNFNNTNDEMYFGSKDSMPKTTPSGKTNVYWGDYWREIGGVIPTANRVTMGAISTSKQEFSGDKWFFPANNDVANSSGKKEAELRVFDEPKDGTPYTSSVITPTSIIVGEKVTIKTVNGKTKVEPVQPNTAAGSLTIYGDATANKGYLGDVNINDKTIVSTLNMPKNTLTINEDVIAENNTATKLNPHNLANLNVTNNTDVYDLIVGEGHSLTVNNDVIANSINVINDSLNSGFIQANNVFIGSSKNTNDSISLTYNKSNNLLDIDGSVELNQVIIKSQSNDIADAISTDIEPEYGYCYYFDGNKYNKTSKYCQKGIMGIHSDTYGYLSGSSGKSTELKVAIAGFVLAYVDKIYEAGTPLTCTKDGKLTRMRKKELILHPERLVGTFWKVESSEKWGNVITNGRHWVKVK